MAVRHMPTSSYPTTALRIGDWDANHRARIVRIDEITRWSCYNARSATTQVWYWITWDDGLRLLAASTAIHEVIRED